MSGSLDFMSVSSVQSLSFNYSLGRLYSQTEGTVKPSLDLSCCLLSSEKALEALYLVKMSVFMALVKGHARSSPLNDT